MGHRTIGILLGLGAGLLWGAVFVAPQLLPSFGPAEIALGRYLFYGLFSAGLLLVTATGGRPDGESPLVVAKRAWPMALAFAFSGHVGMYLLLVVGIRLAGATVATALIGTVPVAVAVAGNLVEREFPWRRLALPLALILPGLVAINLASAGPAGGPPGGPAGGSRLLGLLCVVATVGLWTAYGVANARFLRANPTVSGTAWSTVVGVATLALAVPAAMLVVLPDLGTGDLGRLLHSGADLARFVAVSAFLGVVVSWGGTLLWNGASARLPTSLAGQLIVSEILAGLCYVFVADVRPPTVLELVGIVAVVSGVVLGIRRTGMAPSEAGSGMHA